MGLLSLSGASLPPLSNRSCFSIGLPINAGSCPSNSSSLKCVQSCPARATPDSLIPISPNLCAVLKVNFFNKSVSVWFNIPPCMLTLVPVDLSGEEVTIFNTPLWALGPYNAEEGPSTTSICSTSSKDTGITLYAVSLREGTFAILPSVRVNNLELKEELNPRAVML